MRYLARHHDPAAGGDRRRRESSGLRESVGVRSARAISTQCPGSAADRRWRPSSEIRSAETKAGGRRTLRCGTETAASEISQTDRHCDVAEWRGDSRYPERVAATRALAADPD